MLNPFTRKVRTFRVAFGFTQSEMAEVVHLTQSNYSRFENRKIKKPKRLTFFLLARIMLVDEKELTKMYYEK